MFPNILNLPSLVLTNAASPDSLGTFQILDTPSVVLADLNAHQSQSYLCQIHAGTNDIHLVWNPSTAKLLRKDGSLPEALPAKEASPALMNPPPFAGNYTRTTRTRSTSPERRCVDIR